MAIDDNTSYELTGAQVKDLASKIKAKADSSSLATVATSGSYNDLLNKPTIPTVNDGTLTIQQNGTTVGTFTANQSSAATVSLTDTTYSVMTGASSGTAGASGLVPAPAAGDEAKVLSGAGTWVNQSSGSEKAFYYVGYANNDPGSSERTLTLYSDAGMTTTATVQSMADDYFGGKEVHFCYIDTRGNYPIVDTIITTGANKYEGGTTDTVFTFGSLFHGENYITSGVLNGHGTKSGTTVVISYRSVPTVNNGTLTIQQNGTTVGTFTANQSANTTISLAGGVYADDPTTPANPDGWITPSEIDWSTFAYSTTEQRVGTWTDGKPIYQKTINTGQIPSGSSTATFDISGLNLSKLIKLEGRCMDTSSGNCRVMPNVAPVLEDMIRVDIQSRDTLRIITAANSNWSNYSESTVTLWYTKTTD